MAEDLVQEALVRAWRSLTSVPRAETGSRRWLFTVVRRLFVDDFRRRQVRPAEVGEVDIAATVVEEDSTLMVVASHTLRDAVDRLSECCSRSSSRTGRSTRWPQTRRPGGHRSVADALRPPLEPP
ncbi:sigma factor [Actinoplanes sp. CA-131856]